MKYLIFILFATTILTTSCTTECEKTIHGQVIDQVTGDPLAGIEVDVIGGVPTRYGGKTTAYVGFSDENGQFSVSTRDEVTSWLSVSVPFGEYEISSYEFVEDGEVSCGDNFVDISIHRYAYIDLSLFDQEDIFAYRLGYSSNVRSLESSGILKLDEIGRIPVLGSVPHEIYFRYYNYVDELVKKDTITVEVEIGDIQPLQVGI